MQRTRDTLTGSMDEMPFYEYVTMDDAGVRARVSSMSFVPEQRGLVAQKLLDQAKAEIPGQPRPKLLYQADRDMNMPTLRSSF